MLGFGRLTGNMIPRIFQFALAMEPHPYDPARARKLLAEAGYANGFDAGDFYPFPPYDTMGEAVLANFQAVGIRGRLRTMERAAYFSAWREKKLHGVIKVITAAFGNAATRLEPYVIKGGVYAYGSNPEIDDLYARQARELDPRKREDMVHHIQQIVRDKVINIPSSSRPSSGASARGSPRRATGGSPASPTRPRSRTCGSSDPGSDPMKRQNIQPASLSKRVVGGHVLYSHVVVVEGKKTIFVSGQLARSPSGEVVGAGDMRAQLRQVGENIKAALAAAGATLDDIVKTNTYVTDIEEFFKHVDVRMEYFGALPTSTTVEVRKLAHPDLVVEVEAIAVVD